MSDHVENWRLAAADYCDKQAAADLFDYTKNDVFAEIASRMDGSSEAEKQRLARLHPDWTSFRSKMIEALDEARRAKLRVQYRKMQYDAWMNAEANARNERRQY